MVERNIIQIMKGVTMIWHRIELITRGIKQKYKTIPDFVQSARATRITRDHVTRSIKTYQLPVSVTR